PAALWTVTSNPLTGSAAGSVTGSTLFMVAKGDAGMLKEFRCDPPPAPLMVAIALPEIVTNGYELLGTMWIDRVPVAASVPAQVWTGPRARAATATSPHNLLMNLPDSILSHLPHLESASTERRGKSKKLQRSVD